MKHWIPKEIRAVIDEILPEGKVVPRHTEEGHFYEVVLPGANFNPVYPSVTGKLQILKDEGLMNYKMNQALQYVFAHFKEFTDSNIMEQIDIASRVSQDILKDAGDIGTRVHGYREAIFSDWILNGQMPKDFLSYIPAADPDVRSISCVRALRKFCDERGYVPVKCEMLVYSNELKTAGTLDDLGLMRHVITDARDPSCEHGGPSLFGGDPASTFVVDQRNGKHTCLQCGYQFRYEFVLVDIKTSNQFKDHYFFQVALYWYMLWRLTGLKPEKCYIVKLSKETGEYKLEELKRPSMLAKYARYMIRTNEGMEFIKSLRKDNQRRVVQL